MNLVITYLLLLAFFFGFVTAFYITLKTIKLI